MALPPNRAARRASQPLPLPSIREMFPEYVSERPTSSHAPHFSHAARKNYPSDSNSRMLGESHAPADRQRSGDRQQSNRTPTSEMHHSLSSRRVVGPSTFHPHEYSPKSSSSRPSSPRRVHQTQRPQDQAYFFDVLRCDPLTSSLEHIASSTTIRHRNALGASHDMSAGMTNGSTPAFRVAVPRLPPESVPAKAQSRRRGGMYSSDVESGSTSARGASTIISFPVAGSHGPSHPVLDGRRKAASERGGGGRMGEHSNGPCQGDGGKRHECPHCNKRFNRPSSLRIHVNTHTGAKPFQCPYPDCGRQFNVNSNMRRHYRNHVRSGAQQSPLNRDEDDRMDYEGAPPFVRSNSWSMKEDDGYEMEESFDTDEDDVGEEDEDLCDVDELAPSEDEEYASCSTISSSSSLPPTPVHSYNQDSGFGVSQSHVRTRPDFPIASPSVSPSFECRYTSGHGWNGLGGGQKGFPPRAMNISRPRLA